MDPAERERMLKYAYKTLEAQHKALMILRERAKNAPYSQAIRQAYRVINGGVK